jgi:hypothetical protein
VHGVGAAQAVRAGQLPGVLFYGCGELDRAHGGPVLLPRLFGRVQVLVGQVVVAAGGGQGGPDFGVGQPTG